MRFIDYYRIWSHWIQLLNLSEKLLAFSEISNFKIQLAQCGRDKENEIKTVYIILKISGI